MATSLPPFPSFSISSDPVTVSARWTKWLSRFEYLIIGLDIADTKRKRALLLHYGGEEICDLFDTFEGTGDDYETARDKFKEHFKKAQNSDIEEYKFREMSQKEEETIDQFHARLKSIAANCEFHNADTEIRRQVLRGTRSRKLRNYGLQNKQMTLAQILEH